MRRMTEIRKSVLRSVRLDDDVWEAVKGMECSLNVYLRESLLGNGVGMASSTVTAQQFDPATVPGVSRGVPVAAPAAAKAFTVMCQHCGSRFSAESRRETTCGLCAENGHKGSRYDCDQCRLES